MPKQVISPGQALLLLIKHAEDNAEESKKLKKLYLSGIESRKQLVYFYELMKNPILEKFEISRDPNIINQDPTRRYFETHLSYRTLEDGLKNIDQKELANHSEQLMSVLQDPQSELVNPKQKERFVNALPIINRILRGECLETDPLFLKEYANYIRRVENGELFSKLNKGDRNKITLMVKSSLLGVVIAMFIKLPVDIYGKGIYSDKNKGKVMKIMMDIEKKITTSRDTGGMEGHMPLAASDKNKVDITKQTTTRSRHMGVMKGHMPLAANDIALSDKEWPLLKPSDQATYQLGAQWVNENFDKLVHPFSNSISGTMLCQLRNLAQLRDSKKCADFVSSSEKLNNFCQLFIATMLYGSGGHTLHEFASPLSLEAIKAEFESLKKQPITLETMFYDGNHRAFNCALEETVRYNQQIIEREMMLNQLRENPRFKLARDNVGNDFFDEIKFAIMNLKMKYVDEEGCFFVAREITPKQELILERTKKALIKIDDGDYGSALKIIQSIKEDLDKAYGKINSWNKPSRAFELVHSLETEMIDIHKKHVNYHVLQTKKMLGNLKKMEKGRAQTAELKAKEDVLDATQDLAPDSPRNRG